VSLGLFLILLAACVAYWHFRRKRPAQQLSASPPTPEHLRPVEECKLPAIDDPFLNEVAVAKRQSEQQIETATRCHERELETRFSDDIQVRERLSQFARQQELDSALVALWKEIKHYPTWAKREDWAKWNKLELVGLGGSHDGEVETVWFSDDGHQYTASVKSWEGIEGNTYEDLSFLEDGAQVFAIECTVDYSGDDTIYSCHSVSAFKKRGNWAKLLIHLYSYIQIACNKSSSALKYFRADEIKGRFEE